jgi:hypothetical protein
MHKVGLGLLGVVGTAAALKIAKTTADDDW